MNRLIQFNGSIRNMRLQKEEILRLRGDLAGRAPMRATVAVVITTYKRPDLLARAVESALNQDFRDTVVVVIDDHGGQLPPLPHDDRLVVVSLSKNSGTCTVPRNVGMALVESQYVAVLDDDNIWLPNHLAVAIAALREDPSLDLVYTAARRVLPDGSVCDIIGMPCARKDLKNHTGFFDSNALVFKRSTDRGFSVVPRRGTRAPGDDWEFVWRLSRRGRIRFIPECTVDYTLNPNSYFRNRRRSRRRVPASPD